MCLLVLVRLLAGTVNVADAALLTFEGQENTIYTAPIVRLGFELGNPAGQEQHFHEITSTNYGLPNNGTGILLNDRDTQIYVKAASGLPTFTMPSVDVAAALGNQPAIGLTITGFLGAATTGTINIASLGSGYTSVTGSALGVVDRLIFDGIGGGGGFALDNLLVNNVPEAASFALVSIAALTYLVRFPRTVHRAVRPS
jgi:hypothetical protein